MSKTAVKRRRDERDLFPDEVNAEVQRLALDAVKGKTDQELLDESIMEQLQALGGKQYQEDTIIQEGNKLILPETMSPGDAIDYLHDYLEGQEAIYEVSKTFNYRPWDGAAALERAMRKLFGTAGVGRTVWSFFGPERPELKTINIGVRETMQVPWGRIQLPTFEGHIDLGSQRHRDLGLLFQVQVTVKKRFRSHVEGLFKAIDNELRTASIYKGKAIDGQGDPEFLDLAGVDPKQVIYSDEVITQLDANLWTIAEHTDTLREMGIPRKRAVLLEGPYGTGKSLAAFLTAQRCVRNDWTFIYCRPARDNIGDVMAMARMYQPAMVFFEDVDTIASTGDQDSISYLLDLFDGIQAKGTEIVMVLTTNHKDRIHRGMLRPGRLDAMVHIGALDRNGIMRLVQAVVPDYLLAEHIDFDKVYESMHATTDDGERVGYTPAFAREAIDRAMRYAIARSGGVPQVLTTEDFVGAAEGLRPQLELMHSAGEGKPPSELATALRKEMATVVNSTAFADSDGDQVQVGGAIKLMALTPSVNGKK